MKRKRHARHAKQSRQSKEIKMSKFLSLVLRHQPETLGITLDEHGWTDVTCLLKKMSEKGFFMTMADLEEVVNTNNKKRFAFNETKTKIRANQGHSVAIDLALEEKTPPDVLYHGTAMRFLESIMEKGLLKRGRHHVHLSPDIETASSVGKRHGKLVILMIQAKQMHESGHVFYQSDNGVWLTDSVPVDYFTLYSS